MHERAKPDRPLLSDGVVDWDSLVDDPDEGLVLQILEAETAESLKHAIERVMRFLFIRADDRLFVASYIESLTGNLEETALSAKGFDAERQRIIEFLHNLKLERKDLAHQYRRRKCNPVSEPERSEIGRRADDVAD